MFSLKDLLKHDKLVIQCHNFPDADTLASAFGVYKYLIDNGRDARIIYSGSGEVTKPNLVKMLSLLSIPVFHVQEVPRIDTLVLVDCQYGESNVKTFGATNIYQIDHHEDSENGVSGVIRSNLGSCSTLVWDLLKKEGFDFDKNPNVATALYYGLFTDTNNFEEIYHPLDKDLRDGLPFDKVIVNTLRYNNLSIEELTIAGYALIRHKIDRANSFAIFKADNCDQNILGFISDLAMQVNDVNVTIVYNSLPSGYKFSVRSCTREVMANEIAHYLAGGGGHKQKAGGFIPADKLKDMSINQFIDSKVKRYFDGFELVYADNHNLNVSAMPRYIKRKIPIGCALSTDIFAAGTPMLIRTLEGDTDVNASEDILLMIGPSGEVYPIRSDKFVNSYDMCTDGFIRDYVYSPTVKNKLTGETFSLIAHAKACIPRGQAYIHAEPIKNNTKVFTKWSTEGYMSGVAGDYIAARSDDFDDVYIIKESVFCETYDRV